MNAASQMRISVFWKDRRNFLRPRKPTVAALVATSLVSSAAGTRKNSDTDRYAQN